MLCRKENECGYKHDPAKQGLIATRSRTINFASDKSGPTLWLNSNNGNRESIEERLNKQDAVLVKVLEDMKQILRNTSYYAESGYLPKADCSKQE